MEVYTLGKKPAGLKGAFARTRAEGEPTVFEGVDFENCILYVPVGTEELYCNAEGWKNFKHIVPIIKKGDVNLDDSVNAADIVEVVNYIMGKPSGNFNEPVADMNGDGVVNAADIVLIVNIIMGS